MHLAFTRVEVLAHCTETGLGSRADPRRRCDGDGNVRATVDFRAVYASLLEQWFDVDAAPIVPDAKRMRRHRLVKA